MREKPELLSVDTAKQILNSYLSKTKEAIIESNIYNQKAIEQYNLLKEKYFERKHALREEEASTSPNINVFDILEFTDNEMHHSRFLAWLFNCNGTHSQGGSFLRIFLEKLNPPRFSKLQDSDYDDYDVITEEADENSRIDIRIWKRSSFLINIENKINAIEGEEQTKWENIDAIIKADEIDVDKNRISNFFLTNRRESPKDDSFEHIFWEEIRNCLNIFSNSIDSNNNNLRQIIRQYVCSIEKNIIAYKRSEEDE